MTHAGDAAGSAQSPIDSAAMASMLGLRAREHVALVGGGGKTTLMRAMALGAAARGQDVIATTTTKMGASQADGFELLLDSSTAAVDAALAVSAAGDKPLMVWTAVDGGKAMGVEPEDCDSWFEAADERLVVVEADGARRRPFKAHGPFEPVIPSTATVVISVIGADALGRVIADQCHRPLRVAALAGCSPYVRLTPEAAAQVIMHERGVRQFVPAGARFVVVVTKVADANRKMSAELLSSLARFGAAETVAVAFADG